MTSDLTHDGGDDHYYVAGYSVEDDPYVYPNGVLINLLNIQDTATSGLCHSLSARWSNSRLNVIQRHLHAL